MFRLYNHQHNVTLQILVNTKSEKFTVIPKQDPDFFDMSVLNDVKWYSIKKLLSSAVGELVRAYQ